MHLHKNASTGCFKKGLVCRLTKLFLWDTLYNYLLLNPPDRHSFMLSSGSASRMTHCIKSRFVRHHKYAEAAERKGGDPTFNNGGVKWALALEPRGATRFLWSWTRLELELCGLQTCHGLQATHYVSALYRNFTNLRLQRDRLYCTFTSLRLLCPRFLSLAFASVSSPPPPFFPHRKLNFKEYQIKTRCLKELHKSLGWLHERAKNTVSCQTWSRIAFQCQEALK